MRHSWRTLFSLPFRATLDLVWLGVLALVICAVSFAFDAPRRLYSLFAALGAGIAEVVFLLVLVGLLLANFVWRRWREAVQAEIEFRAAFEHAPFGVFRSTLEGRFLMVNPALAHLLGYESPRALRAAVTNIQQQLYMYPEAHAAYLERLTREDVVRDLENQLYRKDGSVIWVLITWRAERDARGNLVCIDGYVQDITARKEVEEAYTTLSMRSLQAQIILQAGHFVFVNPMTVEMLGYSMQELLDFTDTDIQAVVHPDDKEFIFARVQDVLAGRLVPSRHVFQFQRKDGHWRWMEVQLNRIEFHRQPAVLAVGVDITERKVGQDKMQENMLRAQMREDLTTALARGGSDLDVVVNALARAVVGVVGESCTVMLVNADGQSLEPVAYYHPNPRITRRVRDMLRVSKIPIHTELYATVIANGQPMLLEQIDERELMRLGVGAYAPILKPFRAFALLLMPLRAQTKIIGVLAVARHRPAPAFQPHEQPLLEEMADRAAFAVANAQRVTQLQRELEARRHTEEKYRALVEQVPAITYTASAEAVGETLYISPQIQILLGFTAAEWISTRDFWASHIHPEDRSWVMQASARARHMRLPFQAEYRLLARDGAVHWVRDEARLVFDDTQRVRFMHGVLVDITAYKLLEQKYAQTTQQADAARIALQRERVTLREFSLHPIGSPSAAAVPLDPPLLRALVENSGDMLAALAEDGTLLFINPVVQEYIGFTPMEMIGKNYGGFVHPDDLALVAQQLRALVEQPTTAQRFHLIRIRAQDGTWRLFEAIGVNRLDHPDIRALLFNVRDVTVQVAREQARLQAETAEREQHAFAAALSDATALMNRATDYEQVLEGILDTVARIVPYETASIFMRDGALLKMARARGFEKFDLQEWIYRVTFPADMPKFQMLVAQGKPIVITETRADESWIEFAETNWIRSQVSAPIRVGGETVGMLGLDSATPNFYNAEHGARLMAFADLAAAALRNARLLIETTQRAQQLALLYDMGLTLNRVLDARTQLNFLFTIAQRALRSDNMAYFQYDPKTETVLYEMGVGVPRELEAQLRNEPLSVLAAEGAVGWIAHHRLPTVIPDVNQDARWQKLDQRVHSAVGVPVEHETELRGVLIAARYTAEPFTPQDERLMILFGNQVAAAMELTRLFQVQTQRQHELEILREASLAFAAAHDRATLAPLILQFALRLVAAHKAFLFFYQNEQLEYGGTLWMPDSPLKMQEFTPRPNGFTYTVARTGELLAIDHVNTHPLFATWQWGGAIVGLPLKGGGVVRAVLNIAYEHPHSFAPAELRALELLADQAAVALENVRHAQETAQQLRDAQLLHRAGEALNRTLSFEETLEQLADFFMEAVLVDVCCISTVNQAQDEMRVILDRDPLPETRDAPGKKYTLSLYPHIVQILRDKRTLTLRRDAPDLPPGLDVIFDEYKWKALMMLPLLAGDEIIGLIELADQKTVRNITPEQRRLAESLAHQAASALHNAQLFQETTRRAQQLTVLNHLARQVNAAQTLDEMLELIESEIATVLPSDASYIALYDAATEMVDFYRVIDYGVRQPPFQWRLGPSFTRQVITTARAVRMDDRREDPSVENPAQFYGEGSTLCSWLGVPIRSGELVLGVISLQAKQRAAFTEADEQLLQTIADQVAAALERAQHRV